MRLCAGRMKRRDLLTLAGGALAAWPAATRAQQSGRTYRVGLLVPALHDSPQYIALYQELRRHGFVDGQNLKFDQQGFRLRPEQFAAHAADLVKAKVDVIQCAGASAIRAAQQATATIPILGLTDDIVGEGLVKSLAHPGGNTTGVSIFATELDGKRQELLIELIPGAHFIATLADSGTAVSSKLQALRDAARAKGVDLVIRTVTTREEIAPALDAAKASGAAGLNVLASPLFFTAGRTIFERAAALRLPAIYQWPEMAQEGGLVAYGPSIVQIFRQQMSRMLIRLLQGTKPADMPIERPTRFRLVINLKTARRLGLTIPPLLLARADEVIE
jgi:ABC-type uncharacterized transport system substrate-binding protein